MYWLGEVLSFLHISPSTIDRLQQVATLLVILLPIPILSAFFFWSRPRQRLVPPYRERVLILGASSGVGKALALDYASRGCRQIAIVGRRKDELDRVAQLCRERKHAGEEWEMSQEAPGWESEQGITPGRGNPVTGVLAIQADCSNPEDLIRVRQNVEKAFLGLDTLHICFGVSALRPLLGIAGIDPVRPMPRANIIKDLPAVSEGTIDADLAGLEVVRAASQKINEINVVATSLVLTAFLPMMQIQSVSPSIHLLSSVAAVVPPPTRALYGSSKAAQLSLFQAVALEARAHAKLARSPGSLTPRAHVRFFASLPGTIASDFRQSAVDGSPEESKAYDNSWDHKGKSDTLRAEDVAQRCILAIDRFREGIEEMPAKYWFARRLQVFAPSLVGKLASKKYGY